MIDETLLRIIVIINYVISGLSISFYLFYWYCLIKKGGWEYNIQIKTVLLLISFFQSSYYFFGKESDVSLKCTVFGVLDIALDFSKISVSIIIPLINARDKLTSDSGKVDTKNIIFLNALCSIVIPIILSLLSILLGEIAPINNSFCYATNKRFRIGLFTMFFVYYFAFFVLMLKIGIDNKNALAKIKYDVEKHNSDSNIELQSGHALFKSLFKYLLVQLLKFIILIVFVINFFCDSYLNRNYVLYRIFVDSPFYLIFSILIQNLSIPLFLLAFGFDVINGVDITKNLCTSNTAKTTDKYKQLTESGSNFI